jgi:ariadne-1
MESEKQKERIALQEYAFFYERYQNNNLAMKSANQILSQMKAEEKPLAIKLALSLIQLEFLTEACHVLRMSKRVLKWSYAYGFYLKNDLQKNIYAIIQEKLDMYSSELHVLLEKNYQQDKEDIGKFTVFKEKVLSAMFKCKRVLKPK